MPGRPSNLSAARVEGREITLEFDRERKDREGRLLAYVYSDGTLLNEDLIRFGLAHPETGADIDRSMATRFRHADDEAHPPTRAAASSWGLPAVSAR